MTQYMKGLETTVLNSVFVHTQYLLTVFSSNQDAKQDMHIQEQGIDVLSATACKTLRFRHYYVTSAYCGGLAGYPSAFYCTLNTHYRIIVSYRIGYTTKFDYLFQRSKMKVKKGEFCIFHSGMSPLTKQRLRDLVDSACAVRLECR